DEDLKRDLRQPVILENHQVQAVGQIRFHRLRQRDFQDLVRDRDLALTNDTLCRGFLLLGGDDHRRQNTKDTKDTKQSLYVRCPPIFVSFVSFVFPHRAPPPPGAAFGVVVMTLRFSFVKYCFATRWTSAAVSLVSRSQRLLICPGSS